MPVHCHCVQGQAQGIHYCPRRQRSQHINQGDDEGFDEDGEVGAGEKLLSLLRKLQFNCMAIYIGIWHNKIKGSIGPSLYKAVLDQARV